MFIVFFGIVGAFFVGCGVALVYMVRFLFWLTCIILGKIVIPAVVGIVLGCVALWQRHKYKQGIRRGEPEGHLLDEPQDEPEPWRSY